MERSRTYLAFGLAAILALVAVAFFLAGQIQPTSAAGGGPEMRLDADGCTADCTFDNNEKFTLAVEVIEAPADPYVGVQTFIDFGTDLTYDIDLLPAADEVVWPDCEGAVALRDQPNADPSVVFHGCLSGLIMLVPSTFEGIIVEISLTCSAASSTTEIRLLPLGDELAATGGAAFAITATDLITPKVGNLSVRCGEGPPADTATPTSPPATNTPCPDGICPTDTPTPTATDTPTATPVPDRICGDVDGDGEVDELDTLWVLWFDAGLVPALFPLKDNNDDGLTDLIGDMNRDRIVNSIDAALISQFVAGLLATLDCELA